MDIDIDLPSTFDPTLIMKQAIPASMIRQGELVKHPCGHYVQNIPVDRITGLAAIPYDEAEEYGFFKFDFLHLSILDAFTSKDEIRELLEQDPNWGLLQDPEIVGRLFHLSKHAELLQVIRPKSVIELADTLAIIRPGKRKLLPAYLADRKATRAELYTQTGETYAFKRSHAISYALTIVLQLHLISQGRA